MAAIVYTHTRVYIMVRVFANGLGDWGSIPGWVIPKIQQKVLDATLLNTKHYELWIKGKVDNPWKGAAPFPTPQCSSYWKGSLQVALDYSHLLYFYLYIYIYIYIYTHTHTHTCIYIYIYIYIYTYISTHLYKHIYTHTHTHTQHKHIHIQKHIHTHTHIYINIHTHTHIYI